MSKDLRWMWFWFCSAIACSILLGAIIDLIVMKSARGERFTDLAFTCVSLSFWIIYCAILTRKEIDWRVK